MNVYRKDKYYEKIEKTLRLKNGMIFFKITEPLKSKCLKI